MPFATGSELSHSSIPTKSLWFPRRDTDHAGVNGLDLAICPQSFSESKPIISMKSTRRSFLRAATILPMCVPTRGLPSPRLTKNLTRSDYLEHFRYWFSKVDEGWDERKGRYEDSDPGSAVIRNAAMLPCLALMALEGESKFGRRIPPIVEHLTGSPPWDPDYHYWNQRFDRLGMEPHAGMSWVASYLAITYMYRQELRLPSDLMESAMGKVQQFTAKMAEAATRAKEYPLNCYIDDKGQVVNPGPIVRQAIRQGVREDLRWLREGGPSNQLFELEAASLAYLATHREIFWEHVQLLWSRIIESEQNGKPILFRSCMDPDYSFIYGTESHRYTIFAYAMGFLAYHSNAVRIARKVGRSKPTWERLVSYSAEAVFGRVIFRDGTSNLVLNAYGWERSGAAIYLYPYWVHPMVSIADLSPFSSGQLKRMIDHSLQTLRSWEEKGSPVYFPPDLGLKGYHRGPYIPRFLALTLANIILTNPEALRVEEPPRELPRCYSGFAWEQKHFVFQTPSYLLTIVGTGTPYHEEKGHLGTGMTTSGGEYVLKVPDGPFLTPLSNFGRNLLSARIDKETLCSSHVHFFNRDEFRFRMEVILPDGTRVSAGEEFGPPPYDTRLEAISVEVSFGKGNARLIRRFDLSPNRIVIKDCIEASGDVEIEDCFSRLPLITVDPQGRSVQLKGKAGGRPFEVRPPIFMGYTDDIPYPDQDFIPGLTGLERLEVTFGSGHGFLFEQIEKRPIRLAISRGEWQENRRMRIDGKNLDFHWIAQPTRLTKGEVQAFSYSITPLTARLG